MTIRPISVIVCTHNRAELLFRVVSQLRAQDYPKEAFEIIVVDHRSTDGTPSIIEHLATMPGAPVRYVFEACSGVTFARNRGAEEARYAYLAYLDDDCSVGPDWLRQLASGFDLDKHVAAVSGRVQVQWNEQKPSWIGANLAGWFAANGYLGEQARLLNVGEHIVEGNMGLERRAWQSAGGFLGMEQFGSRGMAAGEVLYLLEQLYRQDYKVAFVPQALAVHRVGRRTRRWMLQRAYWQGVSDAILDYLLKWRPWASHMIQISLDIGALFVLLGFAAGSFMMLSDSQGMFHLARAVRRLGLILGELHLVGDWQRVHAWSTEHDATPKSVRRSAHEIGEQK
jgi:glucosyl-dolichyl phosphate glucuronosyltransferase